MESLSQPPDHCIAVCYFCSRLRSTFGSKTNNTRGVGTIVHARNILFIHKKVYFAPTRNYREEILLIAPGINSRTRTIVKNFKLICACVKQEIIESILVYTENVIF